MFCRSAEEKISFVSDYNVAYMSQFPFSWLLDVEFLKITACYLVQVTCQHDYLH